MLRVLAVLLVLCGTAHAQAEQAPLERHGFTGGLALGGGAFGCADGSCSLDGGVAIDLHVGHMIGPRVAALLVLGGATHFFNNDTAGTGFLASEYLGPSVRLWPLPRFWLEFGPGVGLIGMSAQTDLGPIKDTSVGFGAMAGLGVELAEVPWNPERTHMGAIDLHVSLTAVRYSGVLVLTGGLLVGLSYY
jgi:hypothetical protein